MIDFLAGIMFSMAVWGFVMKHLGDKLNDDNGHDMNIARGFFAVYILVEVLVVGVVTGALFL